MMRLTYEQMDFIEYAVFGDYGPESLKKSELKTKS